MSRGYTVKIERKVKDRSLPLKKQFPFTCVLFLPGHTRHNRCNEYSSFYLCEIRKRWRFVVQTPKPHYKYLLSRPLTDIQGAQFLAAVLESLLVRCCHWRALVPAAGQPSTGSFPMHCDWHAAGGAAVVFIAVHQSHSSSRKGQARRRCSGQALVLFGLTTLVPGARSTQAILLHRISSCWTPSIKSCIRAERKGH